MNKEMIIEQCWKAGIYKEKFDRLVNAKTDEEFYQILADNIDWIMQKQIKVDFNEVFSLCNFNGNNWSLLLMDQPQFAKYCDWNKLDGNNWYWLLCEQPQFAKFCDWNKLDGILWSLLLKEQPQFAKYKKMT